VCRFTHNPHQTMISVDSPGLLGALEANIGDVRRRKKLDATAERIWGGHLRQDAKVFQPPLRKIGGFRLKCPLYHT